VLSYLEKGLAEGARLATGGPQRPDGLAVGYYVRPIVFADVTPEMLVTTEEIFGLVLCVLPFESEEQAIGIANGTPYGLATAVWSADQDHAVAVARHLRAGRVEIIGGAFNAVAPFGGFGQSGYGRELGVHGPRRIPRAQGAAVLTVSAAQAAGAGRDDPGVPGRLRRHHARLALCAYTWDLTTRDSS